LSVVVVVVVGGGDSNWRILRKVKGEETQRQNSYDNKAKRKQE
jgi:hypothetical protein